MPSPDFVCRFCLGSWPTRKGLALHTQQSENCRQFRNVRLTLLQIAYQQDHPSNDAADTPPALSEDAGGDDAEAAIDDSQPFGPDDYDMGLGDAAHSPHSNFPQDTEPQSDSESERNQAKAPGDAYTEIELYPGEAGASFGSAFTKYEEWKQMESEGKGIGSETFVDYWELAQWLVSSGVSGQARTDFVNLPQVKISNK